MQPREQVIAQLFHNKKFGKQYIRKINSNV